MTELIDETYRGLFQEMQAENLGRGRPKITETYLQAPIYFPPSLKKKEISGKIFGLIGVVFGVVLTICGSLIFSNSRKEVSKALEVTNNTPLILTDEAKVLREEMEVTKKILAGLVRSIQTLSVNAEPKEQTITNLNEFPYPIKVLSEKANLREQPSVTEKTLLTVPKDTILLAMEEKEGWVRVSTPKGEEAWVSLDIVQRK